MDSLLVFNVLFSVLIVLFIYIFMYQLLNLSLLLSLLKYYILRLTTETLSPWYVSRNKKLWCFFFLILCSETTETKELLSVEELKRKEKKLVGEKNRRLIKTDFFLLVLYQHYILFHAKFISTFWLNILIIFFIIDSFLFRKFGQRIKLLSDVISCSALSQPELYFVILSRRHIWLSMWLEMMFGEHCRRGPKPLCCNISPYCCLQVKIRKLPCLCLWKINQTSFHQEEFFL